MFIPLLSFDTNIWPQTSVKKINDCFGFVRSAILNQIYGISLILC